MKLDLPKDLPSSGTVLIRTFDDYLSLKHGTGEVSGALAALFRDRYGDDCSVYVCTQPADVVFIVFNHPAVVIPFCERHALQMRDRYADVAGHLPKLTPETEALFPTEGGVGSQSDHLTSQRDESELRDDDEPGRAPRSADER